MTANAELDLEKQVQGMVDAYLAQKEAERVEKPKKMALIATKGTLDMAYPPLILASTAAALGWEAGIFFTFYGLNIIHKDKGRHLSVAPLGNPAAPIPVPNFIGAIPGMTARLQWKTPWQLTANTRPHSASETSTVWSESPPIPAEQTRTSSRPSSTSTRATASSTCCERVTSAAMASAPLPSSSAVAPASSAFRSRIATRAPPARSRSAAARPIPRAPPVTSATRPEKS